MNSHLQNGVTVRHGFFGSQVGVVGDSAYGTAYFNVDRAFGTFQQATFNIWDFGNPERFFAYFAWNLGESCHVLNVSAPSGPYGPAVAGHILDIVSISSVSPPNCSS